MELRIEKKIRKKFTKLRKLQRTLWNHSVSSMYKNVMKKFEVNCLHGKSNIEFNTEINRTSVGTFKVKDERSHINNCRVCSISACYFHSSSTIHNSEQYFIANLFKCLRRVMKYFQLGLTFFLVANILSSAFALFLVALLLLLVYSYPFCYTFYLQQKFHFHFPLFEFNFFHRVLHFLLLLPNVSNRDGQHEC